ncbi:hypothetical protein GCM10017744_068220 [Streptomyces antimycoticus]|uniref:Uncharacterized protein n=1 Tax=Streptomyces antimycoticus TaxID=68175 RepID=A0A4D4K9B8_9ACTN|nr:hypothetical protein SANT12839_033650 [Streptomyces antimycoticus]
MRLGSRPTSSCGTSGLIRTTDYGNRKGVTLRRTDLNTRFPGLLALLASEATSG